MGIIVFVCIVGLVIGGVLTAALDTAIPIVIALCFVGTLIVWSLSDDHPQFNAIVAVIVSLVNAIVFIKTGTAWLYFLLLAWIGYIKTHRVWSDFVAYDYFTIDETIYQWFDDAGTTAVHIMATVLSIAFYMILGALALEIKAVAFLPVAFLLYRAIRVCQASY
ncbi:MAG: hypothetical protein E7663_06670 [Ruminococcaceae bacterium]|nr:hypothetical protein [Oscillospiraceae bacterium]